MLTLLAPREKNSYPSASAFSSSSTCSPGISVSSSKTGGFQSSGPATGQRQCAPYCLPSKLRP